MAGDVALSEPQYERAERFIGPQDIPWTARARVLIGWFVSLALGVVILVVPLPFSGQVMLQEGDVATRDVVAPRRVTYVSDILTQQRRDLAASAVPDVYDPPQARVGRQRLTVASQVVDFIASVRKDSYADPETKAAYLAAITSVRLSPESIARILNLSDAGWDRIAEDIQSVLERAMREEIRESTLADERRRVSAWVSLDLADEDAAIVREVVQALLAPNSFANPEKTDEQRQQARSRIEPVTTTLERNETILRSGDIVTALDVEALEALGLRQTGWTWRDLRGTIGFLLVLGIVFLYYLWHQESLFWLERIEPLLLAGVVLVFLVLAKAMVPAHALLAYFFPFGALAMLLAVVLNLRIALISTGVFVLLLGWMTSGNLELMAYAFCGALVGALRFRRGERLMNFAWAAAYVAGINLLVVAAFRLAAGDWNVRTVVEMASAAMANGLVTMTVTLVGIYVLGTVFGVVTPLQLMDLSRPTHPLLRQLLLKAPGTYHHTLLISNMSERAAEAIGADAQLARVGAYYHDVGKTIRPYFFVENRTEDVDPHGRLDPYTSARIILDHVKDGIDLARKYHLPRRVIDFIPEHHGTLLVTYFYHQAVTQAGSPEAVDKSQFMYPGPRPQSRETAITMLADGVEATVRAKRPGSIEELNRIIAESVQSRINSGQLAECPLTLADLEEIKRAFQDVMRGIHHPRITYPADTQVAVVPSSTPAPVEERHVPGTPAGGLALSGTGGENQHPGG